MGLDIGLAYLRYRTAFLPQSRHHDKARVNARFIDKRFAMKAEDLLLDNQNTRQCAGTTIRKGTVGAFLINAAHWCDSSTPAATRRLAEQDMIDALPALHALGLFDVFEIRNNDLRRFIASHG